jgi:uncharacterized membrane protein
VVSYSKGMELICAALILLAGAGIATLVVWLYRQSHKEQSKGISYGVLATGALGACVLYGIVAWALTAVVFGAIG